MKINLSYQAATCAGQRHKILKNDLRVSCIGVVEQLFNRGVLIRGIALLVLASIMPYPVSGAYVQGRPIIVEHQCVSLDPINAVFVGCVSFRTFFSTPLFNQVSNELVTDEHGAESVLLNEKSKYIDVFLRPEAKWSNGDPVVAEDYILTIKRILNKSEAQTRFRDFANNVVGAEFCKELNAPKCAYGAQAITPHHLRVLLKEFSIQEIYSRYDFSLFLPTPSAFWEKHVEATYARNDLPTYGPYKLDFHELLPEEALETEIRLVPDPLSIRKNRQHFSSVSAFKRVAWRAKTLRERISSDSLPDFIEIIGRTPGQFREILSQQGWKSVQNTQLRGTLSVLLDRETLAPELKHAIILLLDSEEYASRVDIETIDPAYRFVKGLQSEPQFQNKYRIQDRSERKRKARALLEKLGISTHNRKTLNLIYDLPGLEYPIVIVEGLLKSSGLDVNSHFFEDFGSEELKKFRQKNDIHMELLSWISPAFSNMFVASMAQVSVLNLLSQEDNERYLELVDGVYDRDGDESSAGLVVQIEDILINQGAFVVLGIEKFASYLAEDLCLRNNDVEFFDYEKSLVPCEML